MMSSLFAFLVASIADDLNKDYVIAVGNYDYSKLKVKIKRRYFMPRTERHYERLKRRRLSLDGYF